MDANVKINSYSSIHSFKLQKIALKIIHWIPNYKFCRLLLINVVILFLLYTFISEHFTLKKFGPLDKKYININTWVSTICTEGLKIQYLILCHKNL
jgi:hypothetical protein